MYARIDYIGDGVTTRFPLTFPLGYLRREFVKCLVDSERDSNGEYIYRQLIWDTADPNWVTIAGDAPGVGVTIVFTRVVPKDYLMYNYQNGAPLSDTSLDESNKQLMMAIHEFIDLPTEWVGDLGDLKIAAEDAADRAENAANGIGDVIADVAASQLSHEADPDAHKELFENVNAFPEVDPGLAGKALALVPQGDGTFKWQPVGSGEPVGKISWMAALTPPTGYLALSNNNGLLIRSGFEALWAEAQRSGLLRTEAEWQAEFAAHGSVGFYSSGDGSTTFRVPLLRRVFLRSNDPEDTELPVGRYQGDTIGEHAHRIDTPAAAYGSGTGLFNANYSRSLSQDTRMSGVTGEDETRPVTMVLLPIMKAFDTIIPPSDLVLSEAFQQLVEINNKVSSEAHIRGLAGTRVWTSAEYPLVANTRIIVTHNIPNLDTNTSRAETWLRCVVAEHGYAVGDIIRTPSTRIHHASSVINSSPQTVLGSATVSAMVGSMVDGWTISGSPALLTLANWRYIFKIWY